MGWEDRPYYRDRGPAGGNGLTRILFGSVPLFTAFGIRVRAHATLLISMALILLFGYGYSGFTWQDRVQGATMLFLIVLLHEFGHCFTARWVGGQADEILMHPLGGLALTRPPHRPLPVFLTVAGGPAVNVLICVICGAVLLWTAHWVPLNPFRPHPPGDLRIEADWLNIYWYALWIYQTSLTLLFFNLLPIYPLDGGQMLHAILWPRLGYYKATILSCNVGMVACAIGGMIALATLNLGLAILAVLGFMFCLNMRRATLANGPEIEGDGIDYSAAYDINAGRPKRQTGWRARRQAKAVAKMQEEEASEQETIDRILAKVSAQGMNSLTRGEKKALQQATENQRKRDAQRRRPRM